MLSHGLWWENGIEYAALAIIGIVFVVFVLLIWGPLSLFDDED